MSKRKVKVYVEGFGTVLVDRPKSYTRKTFADGVAEGVAGAVGLVMDRDRTSFHPVLGRGGYDWNHEAQRTNMSEAQTPVVAVDARKRDIFRVRMHQLWKVVQGVGARFRGIFYQGGK